MPGCTVRTILTCPQSYNVRVRSPSDLFRPADRLANRLVVEPVAILLASVGSMRWLAALALLSACGGDQAPRPDAGAVSLVLDIPNGMFDPKGYTTVDI